MDAEAGPGADGAGAEEAIVKEGNSNGWVVRGDVRIRCRSCSGGNSGRRRSQVGTIGEERTVIVVPPPGIHEGQAVTSVRGVKREDSEKKLFFPPLPAGEVAPRG